MPALRAPLALLSGTEWGTANSRRAQTRPGRRYLDDPKRELFALSGDKLPAAIQTIFIGCLPAQGQVIVHGIGRLSTGTHGQDYRCGTGDDIAAGPDAFFGGLACLFLG